MTKQNTPLHRRSSSLGTRRTATSCSAFHNGTAILRRLPCGPPHPDSDAAQTPSWRIHTCSQMIAPHSIMRWRLWLWRDPSGSLWSDSSRKDTAEILVVVVVWKDVRVVCRFVVVDVLVKSRNVPVGHRNGIHFQLWCSGCTTVAVLTI